MTAAADLLSELTARAVTIERHGERLTIRARTAPSAELLARVRDRKADLLPLLPDHDSIYGPELRDRLLALAAAEDLPSHLVRMLGEAEVVACRGLDDSELRGYLHALARSDTMDHGRAPPGYVATVHCEACGPVLMWPSCPPRLKACPWCFRRNAGKPIPRPNVRCADCRHCLPDPLAPHSRIGRCAAGADARWPMELHPCALMRPP